MINNALEAHGWPYFLNKEYNIDLNNDGKIDLIHHEFHLSEQRNLLCLRL